MRVADGQDVLSSKLTLFYKFVFPMIWISLMSFSAIQVFLFAASAPADAEAQTARWFWLAAAAGGSALLYWALMRIKWVSLAGRDLVISNYLRTARIPLQDVERASASLLMNPQLVWLRFRRPTAFGAKIVFMPTQHFFGSFWRHPVAHRINELVAAQTTENPTRE